MIKKGKNELTAGRKGEGVGEITKELGGGTAKDLGSKVSYCR